MTLLPVVSQEVLIEVTQKVEANVEVELDRMLDNLKLHNPTIYEMIGGAIHASDKLSNLYGVPQVMADKFMYLISFSITEVMEALEIQAQKNLNEEYDGRNKINT